MSESAREREIEAIRRKFDTQEGVFVASEGELIPAEQVRKKKKRRGLLRGLKILPTRWYIQWYLVRKDRLVAESKVMKLSFPQFKLKRLKGGALAWRGEIVSNKGNRYDIALIYPENFPYEPIKAYILFPKLHPDTPHVFADGSLCLFAPSDRGWDDSITAATMAAKVAAWIFAYEYWLEKGVWPGPSAD